MQLKDLTGQKYWKLTVTSYSHSNKWGKPLWNCKCDCGVEITRLGQLIVKGSRQSCGCDRAFGLYGTRYGKLLAVSKILDRKSKNGSMLWKCICDCGNITVVESGGLMRGKIRSCGCLIGEMNKIRNTTHGMSKTGIYAIWTSMVARCKTDGTGHPDYGGRGITVCDEWLNSFEKFYSDVGDRPEDKTLDRIDFNGNYEPTNVRWADHTTQQINQRLKVNNKTGVKGVTIVNGDKYLASLKVYGEEVLRKVFGTLEEAIEARREAEDKYHKPLLEAK